MITREVGPLCFWKEMITQSQEILPYTFRLRDGLGMAAERQCKDRRSDQWGGVHMSAPTTEHCKTFSARPLPSPPPPSADAQEQPEDTTGAKLTIALEIYQSETITHSSISRSNGKLLLHSQTNRLDNQQPTETRLVDRRRNQRHFVVRFDGPGGPKSTTWHSSGNSE